MSAELEDIKIPQVGGNDLSAMIDKLLANPEIIQTVASALSKKDDGAGGDKEAVLEEKSERSSEEFKGADIAASLLPMISKLGEAKALGKGAAVSKDKRACLLLALKPYLCQERCEAIDQMVRLLSMTELLKSLS